MGEPIVYVSTWRIKEGKSADYQRFYAALVEAVERNEPQVTAFLAYGEAEGSEITNIHVYADQVVLDQHMRFLEDQMGLMPGDLSAARESLEPVRVEVFGTSTGAAAEMDRGMVDSGVSFETRPRFLGGFARRPSV